MILEIIIILKCTYCVVISKCTFNKCTCMCYKFVFIIMYIIHTVLLNAHTMLSMCILYVHILLFLLQVSCVCIGRSFVW